MYEFKSYTTVNSLLGTAYTKDSISYYIHFQAMNADVYGNAGKVIATCYNANSGMFNIYFNQQTSGNMRISYFIYNFGN